MPGLPLIDKQDNFEKIRDEIAAILAFETVNQQTLAAGAGKDPKLWAFDVYRERTRVWEGLSELDEPVDPVVNVWFDSASPVANQSYNSLLHTFDPGIFNIDVFATAINEKNVGTGYVTADQKAVLDAQRIIRLIRNILFSVPPDVTEPGMNYEELNLPGVVAYRRIQSETIFQPDYNKQAVVVGAARIVMAVKYIETGLEGPDQDFELLQSGATTTDGGQIFFEFDLKV